MRRGAAVLVFVVTALVLCPLYLRLPVLPDGDAYYHLAAARLYAEHGLTNQLEWARLSIMHEHFGDKELLFHLALVPFVKLFDPATGGFVALALLGALVAAVLAHGAVGAIGAWGIAIPLLVLGGSADFMLRLIRLRPEIVSLVLILVAIPLASARRTVWLGVAACVYTLSYTAFHAFLGLCVLFFLYGVVVERRTDWRLVVDPAIGVAIGIVAHPYFADNVRVWLVQNLSFYVGNLTVPSLENTSRTTRDTLVLNLGWWSGLAVLWRSRVPVAPPGSRRLRDLTIIAATVFGLLYVLVYRFVTYAVPLATLAVLRVMQARGEAPGRFVRLPWRGRLPFAPLFAACLLSAVPLAVYGMARLQAASARIWRPDMRDDWAAFARALPAGAKVTAPWEASEAFVFWAPDALYLDVLDPIFMAAKDAAGYRLYTDLFEGRVADLPLVAGIRFDSDYYADDGQYPFAHARLVADPRATPLHQGVTYLYHLEADRNADFLLDWKVLPPGASLPPALATLDDATLRSYPRESGRARAFEGYVDGRRLGGVGECVAFARVEEVANRTELTLEVSPYGTAEVFVDDRLAASILSPRSAVLGRGVVVSLAFEPGRHRLAIRTCPVEEQLGFYALIRERRPAS
jgi:hypothetical protein